MSKEVTRTFDVLDRIHEKFQREDALGGKKDGEWYTYSTDEYIKKAHECAMGFLAEGFNKGDVVATVSANRPEWNFADMGLAMDGMIHLPIYPTISDTDYHYILLHAEAKCVIVGDCRLYKRISKLIQDIPCVKKLYCFEDVDGCESFNSLLIKGRDNVETLSAMLEKSKSSVKPDDVVSLIYTSGTTGTPKGVMLTHRNLVSNFLAHSRVLKMKKDDRALSFLPLCHVYERSLNYHFQYNGLGIYYVKNLGQIIPSIREIRPTIMNTVPRVLERVYDGFVSKEKTLKGFKRIIYLWAMKITRHFEFNKKYNVFFRLVMKLADQFVYSKWREALGHKLLYIVCGGASLQPRIVRAFGMAGINVVEGYGLTETSPVIAVGNPLFKKLKVGTVGPVMEGVTVKIAEDGEILCKGPSVMKGYYKSPEKSAEVIDTDGWFHTGDIGCFEDEIYLKITDRKKEMFKMSGGKYIAPQMIENKLKESFFIEQAMVIGENEKFASALISPNFEYLHDWCSQQKIQFRDNSEMISRKEVLFQFSKEVNSINKSLGQIEQIKRFKIVGTEWSSQTGELSPTLKLRRKHIKNKYKGLIKEIYSVQKPHTVFYNFKIPHVNLRFDLNEILKKSYFSPEKMKKRKKIRKRNSR